VENEGHSQEPLPEIDRCLAIRANQRNMMHALCGHFFERHFVSHLYLSFISACHLSLGLSRFCAVPNARLGHFPFESDRFSSPVSSPVPRVADADCSSHWLIRMIHSNTASLAALRARHKLHLYGFEERLNRINPR
jgi:hypothetical protein